jgi:hypothetical protein
MALLVSANTSDSRYAAGLPCALRNAGQEAVYCGANSLPRHAAKSSAWSMVFGGVLAFLMPSPPACAGSAQIFQDNFTTNNFLTYNPKVGWPPGVGTSGPQYPQMYSRILFNGWPTNSGSQDPSACNQGGSKDAQCYEEYRTSPAPSGVIFNAENVMAPQFPQFSWQSGEMITNPNFPFGYGFYQWKLFIPPGPGFNRAVSYSANIAAGWPYEVDPFQFIGLNAVGKPSNSDFFLAMTNANGTQTTSQWITGTPCTGWRNIGIDIEAGGTTFWFQNKPIWTTPTAANLIASPQMIVFVGMAVGLADSWEGAPPASVTNVSMGARNFWYFPTGSFTPGSPPLLPLP